jgi:hypothetical protein
MTRSEVLEVVHILLTRLDPTVLKNPAAVISLAYDTLEELDRKFPEKREAAPDELTEMRAFLNEPGVSLIGGCSAIFAEGDSAYWGTQEWVALETGRKRVGISTGGWSYNEWAISQAQGTVWWSKYWQSTSRGGLHVFEDTQ